MGSWSPVRDFEDEMMDLQPDYDMIYKNTENSVYNSSWHAEKLFGKDLYDNDDYLPYNEPSKKNMAKVRELAMKNKKIGRQYDENDSDSDTTKEAEIISMIRSVGLESDANGHLDSKKTLPTVHSKKKYEVNDRTGKFIVFLDESYFKLRPRKKSQSPAEQEKSINKENDDEKKTKTSSISNSAITTTTSATVPEAHESPTSLLQYYEKMKFYSPKEIYYMKKANQKSQREAVSSTSTELSSSSSPVASSSSGFSSSS